jgi:hypothetical protein
MHETEQAYYAEMNRNQLIGQCVALQEALHILTNKLTYLLNKRSI